LTPGFSGLQGEIPGKKYRAAVQRETVLIIALDEGKVLIERKKGGLLEGLWTFPSVEKKREAPGLIRSEIAGDLRFWKNLPERIHYYTRFRDRLIPRVYRVKNRISGNRCNRRWAPLKDLDRYPMPSVYRKIAGDLIEAVKPRR